MSFIKCLLGLHSYNTRASKKIEGVKRSHINCKECNKQFYGLSIPDVKISRIWKLNSDLRAILILEGIYKPDSPLSKAL